MLRKANARKKKKKAGYPAGYVHTTSFILISLFFPPTTIPEKNTQIAVPSDHNSHYLINARPLKNIRSDHRVGSPVVAV